MFVRLFLPVKVQVGIFGEKHIHTHTLTSRYMCGTLKMDQFSITLSELKQKSNYKFGFPHLKILNPEFISPNQQSSYKTIALLTPIVLTASTINNQ